MKLFIINGPNLDMLGIREPRIYGKESYADLENYLRQSAKELGLEIEIFQSNHEGALIDEVHRAYFEKADGIIINAGGVHPHQRGTDGRAAGSFAAGH